MRKPAISSIINSIIDFGISCDKKLNSSTFEHIQGDLVNDSRAVTEGDIFCAVIGFAENGNDYINKAIESGAKLILSECTTENEHGRVSKHNFKIQDVPVIQFYQLNKKLFLLSQAYYQNPQEKMTMIGITGTNGKTSTCQLLGQMLSDDKKSNTETLGIKKSCAIIGTNGAGNVNDLIPLANTTPSATELHQLFYRFAREGADYVAMEASSHAIEQGRVSGDLFDIAIFTNLSRDHLDYHGTMHSYAQAKRALFINNSKQIAVLNGDDTQVQQWLKTWPKKQIYWLYGYHKNISKHQYFVQAKKIKHTTKGVTFTLITHEGDIDINSPLLGDFNIYNLLAAISVLMIEEVSLEDIATKVSLINPIIGRMEATSVNGLPTAVVDYAHTSDALEKALTACREHCHGKLWVVFGCGGDRDKGKRPLMARVAEKFADLLVITSDNPRSESPKVIVDDMLVGLHHPENKSITIELDREQAVLFALENAKVNDIVLLAGKGHEDYSVIGNKKVPYNEREVVADFYKRKDKASI